MARAQDIEPRAYSNAPIGTNFLLAGYGFSTGALSFDTLPLTEAQLRTTMLALGYVRTFGVLGMAAKVDVLLLYGWLSGTANFAGSPISREVQGAGDARLRLTVNVIGAPALTAEQFRDYRQDLIVGASVQVSVPTGQYDPARLINLGTHRWFLRPELGVSQAFGPVTLEGAASVTFFTDNTDFYGGNHRSQAPLYALQAHAIHSFGGGWWASADATYYWGGHTTLNGTANDDALGNWRVGATLAAPLGGGFGIRAYASRGVHARTGNNFDLIGLALQYRWGGAP